MSWKSPFFIRLILFKANPSNMLLLKSNKLKLNNQILHVWIKHASSGLLSSLVLTHNYHNWCAFSGAAFLCFPWYLEVAHLQLQISQLNIPIVYDALDLTIDVNTLVPKFLWIVKICFTFVLPLNILHGAPLSHILGNVMMLDVSVEEPITISVHQGAGAGVHTGSADPKRNHS